MLLRKSQLCWCNSDVRCRYMGLAVDFMSNCGNARSLALQAGCRRAGELPAAELVELRLPGPGAVAAAVATSLGAFHSLHCTWEARSEAGELW